MAAVLVTGHPGVGKTTFVRRVVEALDVPAGGFYTREVREEGQRTGFEIVTLDGSVAPLASVSGSGPKVGRYFVNTAALERVGVPAVEAAIAADHLVVVDEIGKMELLSVRFQRALVEALRSHCRLFGSVMVARHPLVDELRAQPDTLVFNLTPANREDLLGLVHAQLLAASGKLSV
jgi:nucleoside-triphosphatase